MVFRRGGQMRLGGEDLEVLAGEFGVGNGEEFLLDFGLGGEVGVAEDCWRGRIGRRSGAEASRMSRVSKRVAHGHGDSLGARSHESSNSAASYWTALSLRTKAGTPQIRLSGSAVRKYKDTAYTRGQGASCLSADGELNQEAPEPGRGRGSGGYAGLCRRAGRAWPQVVRALRNPNFRLFWSGNFLSNIGTWMQNVAQGWLVLTLTNSAFWLGVVGFAGSIPFLFFTLFGGVIADRVNKRRLLLVTQTVMMLLAFMLAALTWLKIITVWEVVALAFLNGMAMAMNAPSYQALVPRLVQREDLTNAIALNSAQFNMSRILGPTLGGYAMALVGVAGNFFLERRELSGGAVGADAHRVSGAGAAHSSELLASLREGFAYLRERAADAGAGVDDGERRAFWAFRSSPSFLTSRRCSCMRAKAGWAGCWRHRGWARCWAR